MSHSEANRREEFGEKREGVMLVTSPFGWGANPSDHTIRNCVQSLFEYALAFNHDDCVGSVELDIVHEPGNTEFHASPL